MKNALTLLLTLVLFYAVGQDINEPATIGQKSRNQKIEKSLQVGDSLIVDTLLIVDGEILYKSVLTGGFVKVDSILKLTVLNSPKWTQSGDTLYPTNLSSKVGIGTAVPKYNLDIVGNFRVVGQDTFFINGTFLETSAAPIPNYTGMASTWANGAWVNGVGDFTNFGLSNRAYFNGYLNQYLQNRIYLDTSEARISSVGDINFVSKKLSSDTVTRLRMHTEPTGADQMFALESNVGTGNIGLEVQIDQNVPTLKGYATNLDGSTNLTYWAVDSVQMTINTNNNNEVTKFNSNGLVIPLGSTLPTGEEGALFSLTTDNSLYRHNSSYWQSVQMNHGITMGCGDSTYSLSLTLNTPAPITNGNNDLLSQGVDSTRGWYYSGDTIFASQDHGWVNLDLFIGVDGNNGSSLKPYIYKNGSSICGCGPEEELSNNKKAPIVFGAATNVSAGDYFVPYLEDRGQTASTIINNVQFRIH